MDSLNKRFDLSGKIFDTIWSYNLVTVSGNNIKIGNIILAFALFIAGIKYSKKFIQSVKSFIKNKLNTDKDAANALEKIILYITFFIFIITILEIANIPLRTFAFIGGALAIGIGFGAQNIIGNFMSSLIIMVERPIKIGDIVEMEGVIGTVTSIGARCVILTTFSNVDVLIPNNKLMQNTIINWTLNDNAIRYQVEVKVPRINLIDFNPKNFIKNIDAILRGLEIVLKKLPIEVNLAKIEIENLTFLLTFYSNIEYVQNLEYVKNILNLALFENITQNNFTVDYLKVAIITPTAAVA